MSKGRIIVIGSTNMDMVVKTDHIPVPGETVLGGAFLMNPGGKGANQAVSISRLGGDVTFISKVGNDVFGIQSRQTFEEEGIEFGGVSIDPISPSGVALITVDQSGENSIVVASGANLKLSPRDVEEYLEKIPEIEVMLLQLEIPMETVEFALHYASKRGIKVIVNPAPANEKISQFSDLIDIITPNVNEAEMLSGIKIQDLDTAKTAAEFIHKRGVKTVVITMGSKGAVLFEKGGFQVVPANKVQPIDTTAAGDVFNGALALAIAEGKDKLSGVTFASHAASIAVTRMGAQSSIPYRRELSLSQF